MQNNKNCNRNNTGANQSSQNRNQSNKNNNQKNCSNRKNQNFANQMNNGKRVTLFHFLEKEQIYRSIIKIESPKSGLSIFYGIDFR